MALSNIKIMKEVYNKNSPSCTNLTYLIKSENELTINYRSNAQGTMAPTSVNSILPDSGDSSAHKIDPKNLRADNEKSFVDIFKSDFTDISVSTGLILL